MAKSYFYEIFFVCLIIGRYEEFNNLKMVNPNLKTMLAVGGKNRIILQLIIILGHLEVK